MDKLGINYPNIANVAAQMFEPETLSTLSDVGQYVFLSSDMPYSNNRVAVTTLLLYKNDVSLHLHVTAVVLHDGTVQYYVDELVGSAAMENSDIADTIYDVHQSNLERMRTRFEVLSYQYEIVLSRHILMAIVDYLTDPENIKDEQTH